SRAGAVAGVIQSDVPGVDCAAACTTLWNQGATVSLTASPSSSTRFVHWAGACAGNGTCSLTLTQATSAVAVFGPLRIPLRLSVAGKGRIACTPRCGKTATAGNALIFHAIATKGWKFKDWTGACKGKRAVCEPTTDFALAARAVFTHVRVAKKKSL
ncbi:MAG: InlB B-repeat-containing protein, partial [Gaiellaceae bacterium]